MSNSQRRLSKNSTGQTLILCNEIKDLVDGGGGAADAVYACI